LSGLDKPDRDFKIDYFLSREIRNADWREKIVISDYLITKTGDQGPKVWKSDFLNEIAETEKEENKIFKNNFELIKEWPLQGIEKKDQKLRLYRKIEK